MSRDDVLEQLRGLDSVLAAARGSAGSPSYVELSGETYTEEPLKSQDGVAALALSRRKFAKMERYVWKKGEPIYETKEVLVDGQRQMQTVNTGRREKGHWIPTVESSELERKTLVAPTGTLENDTMDIPIRNFHDSPPPSRVLGYEIRERLLPMGQEIYALGHVAWRFRASVGISQGEGSVAVLQPAEDKPTVFTLGSRAEILRQRQSEVNSNGTMLYLMGSLGQQPQQSQSATPRQRRPSAVQSSPRKAGDGRSASPKGPKGLARRRDVSRGTQPMSQKADSFRSKSPSATGARPQKLPAPPPETKAQSGRVDRSEVVPPRRHSDAPILRRENPFDASKLTKNRPSGEKDKVPSETLRPKDVVTEAQQETLNDLDSPLHRSHCVQPQPSEHSGEGRRNVARAWPVPKPVPNNETSKAVAVPEDSERNEQLKKFLQFKALQTKCHQRQVSLRQGQQILKATAERWRLAEERNSSLRRTGSAASAPRGCGPVVVPQEAASAAEAPGPLPRTAEMWRAEAVKLRGALEERKTLNQCLRLEVETLERAFHSLIELGDQQMADLSCMQERNASLRGQQQDAHADCREQHSSYWETQAMHDASPSAASVASCGTLVDEMQRTAAAMHRELGALEAQLLQSRQEADLAQQQAVVLAQQHLQAAMKPQSVFSPSPRSHVGRLEADFAVDPEDPEEMPSPPDAPDALRAAAVVELDPRLQHHVSENQHLELHILHCKERLRQRLLKEQIAQLQLKAELQRLRGRQWMPTAEGIGCVRLTWEMTSWILQLRPFHSLQEHPAWPALVSDAG
eukprot:s143_g14.t4